MRIAGSSCFTLACAEYTGLSEFLGTKVFNGEKLPYCHVTPMAYRELLEAKGSL